MFRKTITTMALTLSLVFTLSAPLFAGADVNTAAGAVLVNGKPAPGLAVHGFDVVAFFTQGRPIQGNARYAAVHNAATYRFASQANLSAFQDNPDKYVPAYGGYCAYGISVGAKFDGDPRFWRIVDGKLYLNLSDDIQQAWQKDIPGGIQKADANWPKLKDKLPSEIK